MNNIVWVVDIWEGVAVPARAFDSKELAIAYGKDVISQGWDGFDLGPSKYKLPPSEVGIIKCTKKYAVENCSGDIYSKITGDCFILYAYLDAHSGYGIIFPTKREKLTSYDNVEFIEMPIGNERAYCPK